MADDYLRITGEDGHGIKVPEHSDESRVRAATALLSALEGIDAPAAIHMLAAKGRKYTFSEHTKDPEDVGCECEDENWWCESGDGETAAFWWFDFSDVNAVVDAAIKGDPDA